MRSNRSKLSRWSFRPHWRQLDHYAAAIFVLLTAFLSQVVAMVLWLLGLATISSFPYVSGNVMLIFGVTMVGVGIYYHSGSSRLLLGNHSVSVIHYCCGIRCQIRRHPRETCRFRIVVFKQSLYPGPLIEMRPAGAPHYLGYGCGAESLQQFVSAVQQRTDSSVTNQETTDA